MERIHGLLFDCARSSFIKPTTHHRMKRIHGTLFDCARSSLIKPTEYY